MSLSIEHAVITGAENLCKVQDDWDAYSGLVEELGKSVQIVGDDLSLGQHIPNLGIGLS